MIWLAFTLLVLLSSPATAQLTLPLHDGDTVEVRGILTLEPEGRLQFVTVRSEQSFIPVFREEAGKSHDDKLLREIGLSVPARYSLLYAHRGETVTAKGIMHTDNASPYFWQGTRLQVDSLRTATGEELASAPIKRASIAAGRSYRVFALLPADLAAPWKYRYMGLDSLHIQAVDALQCSSNGGGDVVNCFCAEAYHASEARATLDGFPMEGKLMDSAQFTATDKTGKQDVTLELMVACSR